MAERRAALAAFKESAADYQQTVLQAFGQVADILQALTHDTNLLAAQTHALSMASEAVRLQRISYGSGGSGIIGLLDAQRQYQQAQLGYVRAEAQRYQDTVQLFVAMGGGWWDQKLGSADGGRNRTANVLQPRPTPTAWLSFSVPGDWTCRPARHGIPLGSRPVDLVAVR